MVFTHIAISAVPNSIYLKGRWPKQGESFFAVGKGDMRIKKILSLWRKQSGGSVSGNENSQRSNWVWRVHVQAWDINQWEKTFLTPGGTSLTPRPSISRTPLLFWRKTAGDGMSICLAQQSSFQLSGVSFATKSWTLSSSHFVSQLERKRSVCLVRPKQGLSSQWQIGHHSSTQKPVPLRCTRL